MSQSNFNPPRLLKNNPEKLTLPIKKAAKMDLSANRPAIRIYKKGEEPDDVLYGRSRPPAERIGALEEIRKQYNDWKYGPRRAFQRVYKIAKRKRR